MPNSPASIVGNSSLVGNSPPSGINSGPYLNTIAFAPAPFGPQVSGWLFSTGSPTYLIGSGTNSVSQPILLPLRDRATISTVSVTYKITAGHSSLPSTFPTFAVIAMDVTTGTPSSVLLGTPQAVPNPGSVSAYIAGGAVQTLPLSGTLNNVIDASKTYLVLLIVDEGGGGAVSGNQFLGGTVQYNMYGIAP